MKPYLYYTILLLCFTSCKTLYIYEYQTSIVKDSININSTYYKDDVLKFRFIPNPSGIFFEIENLTDKNIYIIWDKSYFIDPSDNASRALNSDILETDYKLAEKESYETIIPKNGKIKRFTTSVKNQSSVNKTEIKSYINSEYSTIEQYIYSKKDYFFGNYWSPQSFINVKEYKNETNRLLKQVQRNNYLGLGFTFRIDEELKEYDFHFPVSKILVYQDYTGSASNCIDTLYLQIPSKPIETENPQENSNTDYKNDADYLKLAKALLCTECSTSEGNHDLFKTGNVVLFYNELGHKIYRVIESIQTKTLDIITFPQPSNKLIIKVKKSEVKIVNLN